MAERRPVPHGRARVLPLVLAGLFLAACGGTPPAETDALPAAAQTPAATPAGPVSDLAGGVAAGQPPSPADEPLPGAEAQPAIVGGGEGDRRVVAVVNGESLTVEDLQGRLGEMHGGQAPVQRGAFDLERLVFRSVNDLLIAREARALGMEEEEPTKGQVRRFREQAVVRLLEREQVEERSQPLEEEIRRAYGEQYRLVDLRVLTLGERAEAEAVLREIQGGAEMGELARARSIDPYAQRGGEVQGLPLRDLAPEIGQLARSLQPGKTGGPVSTDLGWSVIRLERFQEPDPAGLEKVRPALRELIAFEKARALRAELARRLQEQHPVELVGEAIERIRPQRVADGRLTPTVEDRREVVARIGGRLEITAGEYGDALLLRWSGVRSEDAARAAAPIILTGLIEKQLLLAEANRLGYGERPEVARQVRAYEDQILVQRYLEEVVAAGIEVGREEMEAYYREHLESFARPPRLNLGQITVATEEEAREVARLLGQGTDLAWLARQRSTDRFAAAGGERGWMSPQPGIDEFNDRLSRAAPGEVIEAGGVPGNFVVLKVLGREEQGTYPLEEVSGNVRSTLFSDKFRQVLDDFVTKLRARSQIRVDTELLASLRVSGSAVEGPPEEGGPPGAHAH